MEKVVVTGVNGYIGNHVAASLADLGYEVTGVDIREGTVDSRVKMLVCDIFSQENVFDFLGRPDRLIHLAWKDGFVHNATSHIEFLPKHLKFVTDMAAAGCKSISVMGSMHEIGLFEGAVTASTPANPRSFYGISKNALRQAIDVLKPQFETSFKWLRGYYILGDDRKNNSIFAKILEKAASGETEFPFTTGANKYDFLQVDELSLQIALASVQDEISGVINCCSGKPVALKDKVEQFIKDNNLNISLKYGAFPDRPYDSKIIYGDNTEILKILKLLEKRFDGKLNGKIAEQIKKFG